MPLEPDDSYKMHTEIIELGIKLGYFEDRQGACQGVTMAWLSACLTDEIQMPIQSLKIKLKNLIVAA